MSSASHHAEWLQLVPHSGPFLSLPVLGRAFPQQLEALESGVRAHTRDAFDDWREQPGNPAVQRAWMVHVLKGVLHFPDEVIAENQSIPPGLEARLAEHGEILRPDFVIVNPAGHVEPGKPRLLIVTHPAGTDLDKPLADRRWKVSPASRMAELCHAANVPLGLVTNGDHWMLVWAPRGETTGYASWFAHLWSDEPLTLRAFVSLLRASRFFAAAPGDTLEALYVESARDQSEVTDQLGLQVRQAVQVLIQSLDRLDAMQGRTLLAGTSEKELYDAALTVMMRLVFLFCAEEKGLLLLGNHLYDEYYAVSTLREQLRESADRHGEELLERRHDAWCRLLAIFRAIHGGIEHDELRLPAYGGGLFDPDRYPFLEGRAARTQWQTTPARPLEIDNRVVLHLLEALQTLETKLPGTSERQRLRLSFRALDIEQIGHVYEGLLDHTARRAGEAVLGLAGKKGQEPEISLAKLEELAGLTASASESVPQTTEPIMMAAETPGNVTSLPVRMGSSSYSPAAGLVECLHDATGRSKSALTKALDARSLEDESRIFIACGLDRTLADRVWPFAALLREDTFGRPLVFPAGSLYVTRSSDRRSTGTHYTPRSLTEPIVQHTLEPLVYVGPAEGHPRAEWKLNSAKELLELKICDLAMGSGAFLVQACRYLGERLVEAWEQAEKSRPGAFITTPEGELSTGSVTERLLPADLAERLSIARRYVADRCLYGVDINPMAVEMATLSLWLITIQRDRPFTFLDHALKCGDSLLGVSTLQQVENFSLRPGERQVTFATANLFRYVEEASEKRRALEGMPSNDHGQIAAKQRLHAEAEAATAKVKAIADLLIALELRGLDGDTYEDARETEAARVQSLLKQDADAGIEISNPNSELDRAAHEACRGRRNFHWSMEFPEVFARGGFDAFVGNPPFMGGQKITGAFGSDYRDFVVRTIADGRKGSADLSVFFMLRAAQLHREIGNVGLVITSAIAEGDNREVGLEHLDSLGRTIIRAETSRPWPGVATVTYSALWLSASSWRGQFMLNGMVEAGITPYLTPVGEVGGKPFRLKANEGKSFIGHYVLGMGFLMPPPEAEALSLKNAKNRDVLFPFLNGAELNATWNSAPTRWVINFRQWPLSNDTKPEGYSGPVAEDYPECLDIVRRLVKPERDENKRDRRRERWWLYGDYAPSLEKAIQQEKLLFAISMAAASHIAFCRVERGVLLSHTLAVFALDRWAEFGVISCSLHDVWTRMHTSYNLALPRYIHTDCFLTFPFPTLTSTLDGLSQNYHDHRFDVMRSREKGSTDIYNLFHDRGEQSADIARLRSLHAEMDQAVAAAYGWTDLDLGHGFHATKQGERYTISESARRTVLDRLLQLNHEGYAVEVKAGLHEKKATKAKPTKKAAKKSVAIPQPGDSVQFGLGLVAATATERPLPAGFRFPASDPAIYSVNLVVAILSEAGGSLCWQHLRDAFVLVTRPDLMKQFAGAEDANRVEAWRRVWNESAQPKLLLTCLRALFPGNIFIRQHGDDFIFQLADGPRPAASEEVGYDAWLGLRVSTRLNGKPVPLPESEPWLDQIRAMVAA